MHESRRDQDASAEVPAQEEGVIGDGQGGEAADDDGEAAGEGREEEDLEEGGDVEGGVVGVGVRAGAACWPVVARGLAAG